MNIIIIPVHNGLQFLKNCIDSILKKTRKSKIIIIDDGSSHPTSEWIKHNSIKYNYVYLYNKIAKGFSSSCNKGIKHAIDHYEFETACLLNSDTEIITTNWFDKVEQAMNENENISCASVLSNNALHQSIYCLQEKNSNDYENIEKYIDSFLNKRVVECPIITGFCYFIKKSTIRKIGFLDEISFPHYGSEDDYSLRCIESGCINVVLDYVFVYHHECRSYTSNKRLELLKNSIPMLKKKWGYEYIKNQYAISSKNLEYLNKRQPFI